MKTELSLNLLVGCIIGSAFLCVPHFAQAAPLPNAWQITDHTSGAIGGSYNSNLGGILATQALAVGWRYSLNARLVDDFNDSATMVFLYGVGTNRFSIYLDLDANNNLTATPFNQPTLILTTNGTGAAVHHTYDMVYNPFTKTAMFLFDGIQMTTWDGDDVAATNGLISWGSGSSAGQGVMRFHTAAFAIGTNVVVTYDAGVQGDPAVAPDPRSQGWTASGTSAATTNAISPDITSLPSPLVATTLAATSVQPHTATLRGSVSLGGLAALAWIEWGTSTNYGNAMPQFFKATSNTVSLSVSLTGLIAETTYHFRCVSTNVLGATYGQDLQFTTPPMFVVRTLADSGLDSLRQAITDAIAGDTIFFATTGIVTLTSGELVITNDLTIMGPGPGTLAVSGNNVSRVFRIGPAADVRLSGITIRNGRAANGRNSASIGARGGNGEHGGGLYIEGTLSLSNCIVTNNATGAGGAGFSPELGAGSNGGVGGYGGGLYNQGNVTITDCTIVNNSCGRGGHGGDGSPPEGVFNPNRFDGGKGGSGGIGGGIFNQGSVTLIHSKLEDNSAGAGGNGGGGSDNGAGGGNGGSAGGCHNSGWLTLSSCLVRDNTAGAGGVGGVGDYFGESSGAGGIGGDAGGIYSSGTLTLTNSTVSNNASGAGGAGAAAPDRSGTGGPSGHGGGLFIIFGTSTLVGCTISTNQTSAGGVGGGDQNSDGAQGGKSGVGGAIINDGTLTLIACTVAGNKTGHGGNGGEAQDSPGKGGGAGGGGAIYNNEALTLVACTVSANRTGNGGKGGNTQQTAGANGGNGGDGGGVLNSTNASFTSLQNTLIALNSTGVGGARGITADGAYLTNGLAGTNGTGPDLKGTFETLGHNLVGKRDGANFVPSIRPTDYIPDTGFSLNPSLGPLANNGGPTMTMALLPGSLAIDTGDDSLANTIPADQRGYLRSSGGHVDIGAFEVQVADPANPPRVAGVQVKSDHALMFSFTNNPGLQFQVLASTNVALPLNLWIRLGPAAEPWPGQYLYIDATATNYPRRFYKVVWP